MPQRTEAWNTIRKDKLTASQMGAWLAEEPKVRITVDEIKETLDRFAIEYKKSAAKPVLLSLLPPEMLPRPTVTQASKDARHTAVCNILGNLSGCEFPDSSLGIYQFKDGMLLTDELGVPVLRQDPPRNPSLWAVWNGIRLEPEAVASFEEWSGKKIEEVGFCTHTSMDSGCSPDGLIVGENSGFEGKAPLPKTHIRYLLDGGLPEDYFHQVHGSMAVTGADSWWFQSYCPGLPPHRVEVKRDDTTKRMEDGLLEFSEALSAARDEIAGMWNEAQKKEGGL